MPNKVKKTTQGQTNSPKHVPAKNAGKSNAPANAHAKASAKAHANVPMKATVNAPPKPSYEYSTMLPLDRADWIKKRAERNQISVDDDGSIWYTTTEKDDKTKGVQDLFNVPKEQIQKVSQPDGTFKYKADNVADLEDIETDNLGGILGDYYKKNNIEEKDQKRFDLLQKNKDNLEVEYGEVYYKAKAGASFVSIGRMFNKTSDEIMTMNNASTRDIEIGKNYHVDTGYQLDKMEMRFLEEKMSSVTKLRHSVVNFFSSSTEAEKTQEQLKLEESGANYIKKRENGDAHMDKSGKNFVVYKGKADKKSVLTVAHGHAGSQYKLIIDGKVYKKGDLLPVKKGDALFDKDVAKFIEKLEDLENNVELKPNQISAAISYAYNTGGGQLIPQVGVKKESFVELLEQGKTEEAQSRFNIIEVANKPVAGLVNRRLEELGIFCDGQLSKEGLANVKDIMGQVQLKDSYIPSIMTHINDYGIKDPEAYESVLKKVKAAYSIPNKALQKKALDAITIDPVVIQK